MVEPTPWPTRAALFRLEFGGTTGWGHLVRSGALASELVRRGWQCDLWTNSAFADAVPAEMRAPFQRVIAADRNLPSHYDWIVVDHYGTTDEQLRGWKMHAAARILVIDDEARRRLDAATLILNSRLGLTDSSYAPGVRTLLGERYALLRPGLSTPVVPEWKPPDGVSPVLVMLGGTDPAGVTELVLEALADLDADSLVPVVIRPGGGEPRALRRFPVAVWLGQVNASELAGWAGVCQFAVSAAGGSLYEFAAVRLPFVSVVVAENQSALATAASSRWGMPHVVAGPVLRSELADAARHLRASLDAVRAALAGIDGRGAGRVVEAMTQGVD